MMERSCLVSVLALAHALPVHAQQVVDQQTRQQVEGIVARLADSLNKGDGQAYQALYASDGFRIAAKATGPQLAEGIVHNHKLGLSRFTARVDDIQSAFGGQGVIVIAPYTATFINSPATRQVQGISMLALERVGESWKIRVATFSRLAAAAPAK